MQGNEFDAGRTTLAAVLLVPFTVAFGAVGALWTAWRPAGAVAVLTGAAVVSYFIPGGHASVRVAGLALEPLAVSPLRQPSHRCGRRLEGDGVVNGVPRRVPRRVAPHAVARRAELRTGPVML
jgi:hypothetical protein